MSRRGQYAQDIFTLKAAYFQGKPPKSVNMYWRRFKISQIPLRDSVAFEKWLRNRWIEKDKLIELYLRTGRFPADFGFEKDVDGNIRRGIGYVEAEIKPFRWYEFLQVFAPIGVLAMVLFMFYGSLPTRLLRTIDKQALIENLKVFAPGTKLTGVEKKALPTAASTVRQRTIASPNTKTQKSSKQNLSPSQPRKLDNPNLVTGVKKSKAPPLHPNKIQKAENAKPRKLETRNHELAQNKSVPNITSKATPQPSVQKLEVRRGKPTARLLLLPDTHRP